MQVKAIRCSLRVNVFSVPYAIAQLGASYHHNFYHFSLITMFFENLFVILKITHAIYCAQGTFSILSTIFWYFWNCISRILNFQLRIIFKFCLWGSTLWNKITLLKFRATLTNYSVSKEIVWQFLSAPKRPLIFIPAPKNRFLSFSTKHRSLQRQLQPNP